MKLLIFIPAYNEEKSLPAMIAKIKELYGGLPLVINDGSTDNTASIAKDLGCLVVTHPINKGLGAACRTGLKRGLEMGADIVVKIDADYQHLPEDIEKVVKPILEDRADAVFGSRFKGGLKYKMPLYRVLGNKFFSYLTWAFAGQKVTDGQTGLMAFHKRYLQEFKILSDYNETQQLILDACYKHFRVAEVPVEFHPRTSGKSFISFKYPMKVLPVMLDMLCRKMFS